MPEIWMVSAIEPSTAMVSGITGLDRLVGAEMLMFANGTEVALAGGMATIMVASPVMVLAPMKIKPALPRRCEMMIVSHRRGSAIAGNATANRMGVPGVRSKLPINSSIVYTPGLPPPSPRVGASSDGLRRSRRAQPCLSVVAGPHDASRDGQNSRLIGGMSKSAPTHDSR